MLDILQPFFLSLAAGLLIGIERERKLDKSAKAIGIRTFILFSLLGTLAAKVNAPFLTLSLSLFIFASLLLSYYRATRNQNRKNSQYIGITTEMAAATVFMLGYLMYQHILLASSLATVVFLVLYGRSSLHKFAKQKITKKEIEASITIIIISLAVISFLPNRTVDVWGLLNPRTSGIIILILAILQFGGYIAIRLFGQNFGMMLLGFFGGLVSSTAVLATISQAERHHKSVSYSRIIAAVFSTIASLISFLLVIFVVNVQLLKFITLPLLTAMLVGAMLSWLILGKKNHSQIPLPQSNPLDLKAIVKLTVVILGVLFLITLTKKLIGQEALPFAAFFTGLFNINAMAYAIAVLYNQNQLGLPAATELLAVTTAASFISKFALTWIIAHNRFSMVLSLFLGAMLTGGVFVYLLIMYSSLLF